MVTHMCTAFATAGSWALRSISHSVSMLTQFHKERKARWSLLESALGRAEADAKKKADGLADGEDRKAIQVECDEAVEETREAGRLLAETIYLLAKEGRICIAHTNVRMISSRTTASAVGGLPALPCLRQRMVWRRGCRSTGRRSRAIRA
ncbi:hypothetical protein ERJ75_001088600 [Trypanosoma vivax]|nr:hypothetical protein ERJ75_001088600 [Trypanosoma vivax]